MREKSPQELENEAREARLDAHLERLGIPESDGFEEEPGGVFLWPKYEQRLGMRSGPVDPYQTPPRIAYYEFFLTVRRKPWGDLDRDASEIRHFEPDLLERLLALVPDGAGIDGFRKVLEVYDFGFEEGRREGYNEGYNDGGAAAADEFSDY